MRSRDKLGEIRGAPGVDGLVDSAPPRRLYWERGNPGCTLAKVRRPLMQRTTVTAALVCGGLALLVRGGAGVGPSAASEAKATQAEATQGDPQAGPQKLPLAILSR